MRDKKATGDDRPGDVLSLLGEDGLKLMFQLINNMWNWRVAQVLHWSYNDCLRELEATKCRDHHKISLIAHTAKVIVRILRRRIEKKMEGVLGCQFGFRRGKGMRDEIWMLRRISEWTLDIDEELCACFVDWLMAFDHVNWTKLIEILKENSIDWHEKRSIIDCKWVSVKVQPDKGEMKR